MDKKTAREMVRSTLADLGNNIVQLRGKLNSYKVVRRDYELLKRRLERRIASARSELSSAEKELDRLETMYREAPDIMPRLIARLKELEIEEERATLLPKLAKLQELRAKMAKELGVSPEEVDQALQAAIQACNPN